MEIIQVIELVVVLIAAIWILKKTVFLVRDDETGIQIRKMFGPKLPQGRIIACNGEVGVQADVLQPGLYLRIPIIWTIRKVKTIEVGADEVGTVEAIDGQLMPAGRLLGNEVVCDSFQDARTFLESGGCRGPQVAILRPGTYRINTELFSISKGKCLEVSSEKTAVLTALDGVPLPPEYLIAPAPECDCSHFQDGQEFLNGQGYRGPQLETLQAGKYYINPLLFDIKIYPIVEVPPGYVAVLRSNVGKALAKAIPPQESTEENGFKQPLNQDEVLLTMNNLQRGILMDPVSPGKYNMNPLAYTAFLVPTSAITIDWASDERRAQISGEDMNAFFRLKQISAISKDGFELQVDTRMIIRIMPKWAPFIIARFGSVENLIEQIAHPLIDSTFRNHAGQANAMEFVHSRTTLQQEALERARKEFSDYNVEAQNLLIAYIHVSEELLETQRAKQIALQRQTQYQQEAAAEQERIVLREKQARAEMQQKVVEAQLSIKIAEDMAAAKVMEAQGIRKSTIEIADGQAYESKVTGEGIASAYLVQAEVIGPSNLAIIKIIEEISKGRIKITPDILVSGQGQESGFFNVWLAQMIQQNKNLPVVSEEPKKVKDVWEHADY